MLVGWTNAGTVVVSASNPMATGAGYGSSPNTFFAQTGTWHHAVQFNQGNNLWVILDRLEGLGTLMSTTLYTTEDGPVCVSYRCISYEGYNGLHSFTCVKSVPNVLPNYTYSKTSATGQFVKSQQRNAYPDDGLLNGVYYYYIGLK